QRSRGDAYREKRRTQQQARREALGEGPLAPPARVQSPASAVAIRTSGGFEGLPTHMLPPLPRRHCDPADVVDTHGMVCASRGYMELSEGQALDKCLRKAQLFLTNNAPQPEYLSGDPKYSRGPFDTRTFSIHLSTTQRPRLNAYSQQHAALMPELMEMLQPATVLANLKELSLPEQREWKVTMQSRAMLSVKLLPVVEETTTQMKRRRIEGHLDYGDA
ncbi:hypothetical protein FRB99_006332, partial [Tulasnella sp. 403]